MRVCSGCQLEYDESALHACSSNSQNDSIACGALPQSNSPVHRTAPQIRFPEQTPAPGDAKTPVKVSGIFAGARKAPAISSPQRPASPAVAQSSALSGGEQLQQEAQLYFHKAQQFANQTQADEAPNSAQVKQSLAADTISNLAQTASDVAQAHRNPVEFSDKPYIQNPAERVSLDDLSDEQLCFADDVHDETIDMRFHVEKHEDPFIGAVIAGRYRICEKIGTGGMGIVYKAQHLNIDRVVAIKMLHPHLVTEQGAFQRFKQEAQAVSKAEHRHIVRIYDFGVSEQHAQPYLVMDFIEGTSLRNLLKNGALPLPRAGELFSQVIDALSAAHEVGVSHRDLKPENIMISEVGKAQDFVYVVDFGISMVASSHPYFNDSFDATPKPTLGSPPYMSPEQCSLFAEMDERSDIYSLAVVIYEAIGGRLPYNARTQSQFVEAHLNEAPLPLKLLNDSCEAVSEVLNRAFEKLPERRYQSIADFGAALKEAVKRDTIRLQYLKNRKEFRISSSSAPALSNANEPEPDGAGETGDCATVRSINNLFITCPHCTERVQRDVAFCLGCGRSLANTQELSRARAMTGVFTLPLQPEGTASEVSAYSCRIKALSVNYLSRRKANKTLLLLSAILALGILLASGGAEAIVKFFSEFSSH